MALNIPRNTWKPETEVREHVVQAICDAFLAGSEWHPYGFSAFCPATNYVSRPKDPKPKNWTPAFIDSNWAAKAENRLHNDYFLVNELEMTFAFNELIMAGYFFFRYIQKTGYITYECLRKNYSTIPGAQKVESFKEKWT